MEKTLIRVLTRIVYFMPILFSMPVIFIKFFIHFARSDGVSYYSDYIFQFGACITIICVPVLLILNLYNIRYYTFALFYTLIGLIFVFILGRLVKTLEIRRHPSPPKKTQIRRKKYIRR